MPQATSASARQARCAKLYNRNAKWWVESAARSFSAYADQGREASCVQTDMFGLKSGPNGGWSRGVGRSGSTGQRLRIRRWGRTSNRQSGQRPATIAVGAVRHRARFRLLLRCLAGATAPHATTPARFRAAAASSDGRRLRLPAVAKSREDRLRPQARQGKAANENRRQRISNPVREKTHDCIIPLPDLGAIAVWPSSAASSRQRTVQTG